MEYLQGEPLSELIKQNQLSFKERLSLASQLANVLAYIHAEGIVHRDIKPANLMITAGNHLKLLDFGLSRYIEEENSLTVSTDFIGSPVYTSPEQIDGRKQKDHRVDI